MRVYLWLLSTCSRAFPSIIRLHLRGCLLNVLVLDIEECLLALLEKLIEVLLLGGELT